MIDVGNELSQARERRALSVADLARRTKIPEAMIQAIERNDAKRVPQGIYIRGFLRAYAREVGCDPEQIVDRYRAQSDEHDLEGEEKPGIVTTIIKVRRESGHVDCAEIDAIDRRRHRAQMMATVGLLCGGILYVLLNRPGHPPQMSADLAVKAPQAGPVAEAVAPVLVGTRGSGDPPQSIDEPAIALRLGIETRGLSWLSATADGRRVIYRLLNAGEGTHIEASEDVLLRIGDAGSFALTVNGVASRPLGAAGQAVTVHLTRQNYREFLSQ